LGGGKKDRGEGREGGEDGCKVLLNIAGAELSDEKNMEFMQTLYPSDKGYDEERLPSLFLAFAARLQKKLLHKMLASQNDVTYDDVEWSSWQNLIVEISVHEEIVKLIVMQQ